MNSVIGALRVVLGMDSAAFSKGATAAEKRMAGFQKKMARVGSQMQSAGARLSAGVTAPLVALAYKSVAAAGEQEKAVAAVDTALRSMGEGAGFTLQKLEAMASKLQDKSLYGDEAILSKVTANLLTFGNVQGEVFERAQQSALDLSARLGQDLQSSAVMLGKALNDPIQGLSALSRVGVSFTAQQKEQIKAMAKAGDVAGAQALMLDELEKQYKGQAEAMAKTDSGRITQAWNAIGDALEKIGAIILPIMAEFADHVKDLAIRFQNLSPETQRFIVIGGALAAAIGPLLAGLGLMLTMMAPLAGVIAAVVSPLGLLAAGVAAVGLAIYSNWAYLKEEFPAITGAIETGLSGVKEGFSNLSDALAPATAGVLEHLRLFGKTIDALLRGDTAAALENGKAMFWNFHNTLTGTLDALLGDVDQRFLAFGAQLVTQLQAAWAGAVTTVRNFGAEMVAALQAMVADILAQAKELGRNIVDGIRQGVAEKWAELKGYVTSLANSLPEWVRSPLQIHSPSRVMAGIGANVVDGLIVGMSDQESALAKAAQGLADIVSGQVFQVGFGSLDSDLSGVGSTADSVFGRMGRWLADLATGAASLKDSFRGMLDGWASSLGSAGLSGLGDFFGMALGPSFGGLVTGFLGGLMGFKDGGSFGVGGAGGIDSQVVAFRASPNETVHVTKPGQGLGGGGIGGTARMMIEPSPLFSVVMREQAQGVAVGVTRAGLQGYDRNAMRAATGKRERG